MWELSGPDLGLAIVLRRGEVSEAKVVVCIFFFQAEDGIRDRDG